MDPAANARTLIMDPAANARALTKQKQLTRRALNVDQPREGSTGMLLVLLLYATVIFTSTRLPSAWLPPLATGPELDYRLAIALSFPKLLDGLLDMFRAERSMHNLVPVLCTVEYVFLSLGAVPTYSVGTATVIPSRFLSWLGRIAQMLISTSMVLGAIGCMSDNPVNFYLLCTLSYISFCASFLYIFEVFELLAQYTLATVGEVRTAFLLTFISWNLFPLAMVLQRFGFLNDLTHQAVVVFLDLGTKIFFSHLMHTILSDFDGMNARVKRVISANARESRQSAEVMRSFVKGICHDIRVPLHSIVLGIQDVLAMNVEEEVEDTVKLMDASAQQMLELLNEVLTAKTGSSDIAVRNARFEVRKVIETCRDQMLLSATHRGISLNLDVCDAIASLEGDELRIRQLVLNFLSNAIKFSSHDMAITLRVKAVERPEDAEATVHASMRGGLGRSFEPPNHARGPLEPHLNLYVGVLDTGIGIAGENLDLLFQDYSQIDPDANQEGGGTGLGLSLSRTLVQVLGGRCGVRSRIGVGSEFWFVLPLPLHQESTVASVVRSPTDPELDQLQRKANLGPKFAPKRTVARLLVVDDVAANRNLLARLLERRGSTVETASDGTVAIEMIQDKSRGLFAFDAILMDGAMAPMGGHECSRRLRAMGVLCPIYAVSGSSEDDDVQTFLEAGATRLMAKPVRIEELISWLKEDTGFAFSHDTQPAKKQGKCPTPRKSSSPRGAEAASSSSSSSSFSSSRQSAPSATETMPPPSLLASAEVSASPPPVSSAMRKRKAADPTTPEARPTATLKTTRSSSRLKRKDGDIREDTPRPKKKYK